MFYTGHYNNYKLYKESGLHCISISNSQPKFIDKTLEIFRQAVPPWALVKSCKDGDIRMSEFEMSYYKHLKSAHIQILFKLVELESKHSNIIFLCYEKDINQCHRKMFASYLNEYNYKCGEFSKKDMVQDISSFIEN